MTDNKIHKKVADLLGMKVPDEEDLSETEDQELIVAMPVGTEVVLVDNPDLPVMDDEMRRLEHTNRQTEFLVELVLPAVEDALSQVGSLPPIYKARAIEVNAKLLEAGTKLLELRANLQLKEIDLKLKMAGFTRTKADGSKNITGNTIIFNREDLIKAYEKPSETNEKVSNKPTDPDDDPVINKPGE
jgi:hypothetical protein